MTIIERAHLKQLHNVTSLRSVPCPECDRPPSWICLLPVLPILLPLCVALLAVVVR